MSTPDKMVSEENKKQEMKEEAKQFRVCIYFKSDHKSDASAIIDYYNYMLAEKESWMLVDIMYDEKNNDSKFREMIKNAKDGHYDFIITPSFLEFATHIVDAFDAVKELCSLNPPVGILFEIEKIYTLEAGSTDNLEVEMFVELHAQEQKEREQCWMTRVRNRKYENGSL